MAYEYLIVQRTITVGTAPGSRYLAVIFRTNTLDSELSVKRIAEKCAMPEAAVLSVLKGLEMAIMDAAQEGEALKLPALGTFYPYINAEAKLTLASVDISTIKKYGMGFYPSVSIKKPAKTRLQNAHR